MELDKLKPFELTQALRASGYNPNYMITEGEYKGLFGKAHVYRVVWSNVDDYQDLLINCDTLYITEENGTICADI